MCVRKVRDLVKLLESDGWYWVRIKGSHHQYRHPTKPGVVTVPGNRSQTMKKYLIIVETTDTGYSAFSADVPGCGSVGNTKEEVERNIQEAIEFHLEGLREEGCPSPNLLLIRRTSTSLRRPRPTNRQAV